MESTRFIWDEARPTLGGSPAELAEDGFQHGEHGSRTLRTDDDVPQWLELLPSGRVRQVAHARDHIGVRGGAADNISPAVELAIGPPLAFLELRA